MSLAWLADSHCSTLIVARHTDQRFALTSCVMTLCISQWRRSVVNIEGARRSRRHRFRERDAIGVQWGGQLDWHPPPYSRVEDLGEHCKLPQRVRDGGLAKSKLAHFSLIVTEHFWWNDSLPSKLQNFWPFCVLSPLI